MPQLPPPVTESAAEDRWIVILVRVTFPPRSKSTSYTFIAGVIRFRRIISSEKTAIRNIIDLLYLYFYLYLY